MKYYSYTINFRKISNARPGTPKIPIIKAEYMFKAILKSKYIPTKFITANRTAPKIVFINSFLITLTKFIFYTPYKKVTNNNSSFII